MYNDKKEIKGGGVKQACRVMLYTYNLPQDIQFKRKTLESDSVSTYFLLVLYQNADGFAAKNMTKKFFKIFTQRGTFGRRWDRGGRPPRLERRHSQLLLRGGLGGGGYKRFMVLFRIQIELSLHTSNTVCFYTYQLKLHTYVRTYLCNNNVSPSFRDQCSIY